MLPSAIQEDTPLQYVMRRVPQVEFRADASPREVSDLAYRALAFMDPLEQDALALQTGLLVSSWDLNDLQKLRREDLLADLDLFHDAWQRHHPTKFREVLPILRNQDKIQSSRDTRHMNLIVEQYTQMQAYQQMRANVQGTFQIVTPPTNTLIWDDLVGSTATHNCNIIRTIATHNTTNSWYYTPNSTAFPSTVMNHFSSNWTDMSVTYFDRELDAIAKQWQNTVPKKEDRKQVRRQMDLLASVLDNPNDVHVFLKGDALEIASDLTGLKYRFKRKATHQGLTAIAKVSHYSTPYHLEVYSQDDVFLTSLCVYIRETPMLDQLAAMIMYIRSGEEAELLQTANFIQVGDSQRLHDELVRMGLVQKARPYHNRSNAYVRLPQAQEDTLDLSDTFLLRSYPEIARLRDRVKDYHFLRLFNRHQLH